MCQKKKKKKKSFTFLTFRSGSSGRGIFGGGGIFVGTFRGGVGGGGIGGGGPTAEASSVEVDVVVVDLTFLGGSCGGLIVLEGADEAEVESGLGGMAGLLGVVVVVVLFKKVVPLVGKRIAEWGRPDDTCKNKNVQYYY